jgi:hypothetical protein
MSFKLRRHLKYVAGSGSKRLVKMQQLHEGSQSVKQFRARQKSFQTIHHFAILKKAQGWQALYAIASSQIWVLLGVNLDNSHFSSYTWCKLLLMTQDSLIIEGQAF